MYSSREILQIQAKLWLPKFGKLDACIGPFCKFSLYYYIRIVRRMLMVEYFKAHNSGFGLVLPCQKQSTDELHKIDNLNRLEIASSIRRSPIMHKNAIRMFWLWKNITSLQGASYVFSEWSSCNFFQKMSLSDLHIHIHM